MKIPLLISLAAGFVQAGLREDLSAIVDLTPTDTIVTLRSAGEGKLELETRSKGNSSTKPLSVSSTTKNKLLESARKEGKLGSEVMTPAAANSSESQVRGEVSDGNEATNRTSFNRIQGSFGAGAIYWAVAVGAQPKSSSVAIGTILLGYPVSYLGHYLYSMDRPWTDAHLNGTVYLSSEFYFDALYGTMALGGFTPGSFQASSFVALAAYPVGLHLGYLFGGKYIDNPGRVSFVSSLSSQGMVVGGVLPICLADWGNKSESGAKTTFTISALGMIGGGIGGHFLAQNLMGGQHIAGGVGPGISTIATLGAMTGVELSLAGSSDPSVNSVFTMGLLGNTLGAVAGYALLPDRRDSKERSTYIDVGMGLGALGGIGLFFLGQPNEPTPAGVLAYPTIGAWVGYGVTTLLTSQLVEKPVLASSKKGLVGNVSFATGVLPVPTDRGTRWTWPGMTVSLR